jgi:SAM-dependent methyltransferase
VHWRIKGILQKTLSAVPGGVGINDSLQRLAGARRDLSAHFKMKVEDWEVPSNHSVTHGSGIGGQHIFEIGSGWYPVLPLCYHLAGAHAIHTFDLNRHLSPATTLAALRGLEANLDRIASGSRLPPREIETRYRRLRDATSPESVLTTAGITYHAPADATRSRLPDASVDQVISNSVLEHVPGPVIAAMMAESVRVLRPGGLAIHSANCADHYAYFDRKITFLNYLQFTEAQWAFWNNSLLYQNRMRPSQFFALAEEAGLELLARIATPRAELLAALPSLQLQPPFNAMDPNDVCCTSFDLVARKR